VGLPTKLIPTSGLRRQMATHKQGTCLCATPTSHVNVWSRGSHADHVLPVCLACDMFHNTGRGGRRLPGRTDGHGCGLDSRERVINGPRLHVKFRKKSSKTFSAVRIMNRGRGFKHVHLFPRNHRCYLQRMLQKLRKKFSRRICR